jgi:hypothetical protein
MKKILILLISFSFIFLNSCAEKKDGDVIFIGDLNYVPVGSIDKGDLMIILYQRAERPVLVLGYNDLYILFRDKSKELSLTNMNYSVRTFFDSGTEKRFGAVFPSQTSNVLRIFPVPTYFTYSDNFTTNWTYEITYNFKNKTEVVELKLEVSDNIHFTGFEYESEKYYISQIEPRTHIIGVMDFDFSIIKQVGETFVYVNDFNTTIKVSNEIRESTNNAAPRFISDGFYKGTIYVPEVGFWNVECDIYDNDKLVNNYVYPIFIKTEQ